MSSTTSRGRATDRSHAIASPPAVRRADPSWAIESTPAAHLDPGLAEAGGDELGRVRAESRERRALVGHEDDLRVVEAPCRTLRRGKQGEFVGRDRPRRRRRDDEGDPLPARAAESFEQAGERVVAGRRAEADRAGDRLAGPGPGGHEQGVVGELGAGRRGHAPAVGIDRGEALGAQPRARPTRERREVEAQGGLDPERLRDQQWPVDELGAGVEQLHLDAPRREAAERQGTLEAGDTGSGDEDASRHQTFWSRMPTR